jgi:large repetitive protein
MPASTWTSITIPWGTTPPALISADVNSGASGQGSGQLELWTRSSATASGTSLTKEGSGPPLTEPSNDWPLTDGGNYLANGGTPPTTATDNTGSDPGSVNGTNTWEADPEFSTTLHLGGTNAYLQPAAATVPSSSSQPTLSLWFSTTTADGVLASVQNQALSVGNTISSGYCPVLYIGNDGKLYAEWWTNALTPISTSRPVDDGLWHHVLLTTSGTTQTLYLDGAQMGTLTGTIQLKQLLSPSTNPTNFAIGAGYIGGGWPNESHFRQSGNTGYLDNFTGGISGITLTH